LLALAAASGAAAAGAGAAAGFFAWSRTKAAGAPLEPVPFRRGTLAALTLAAILVGPALRFAALSSLPPWLWVDDLSLIGPALELTGSASDFDDAIRPLPYGVPRAYGSIGVLYLEGYRAAIDLAGTTVLGVRLPSALGGAASLVTAALLGRALLPAGGGMLTALVLAGLRWHLILSRWAFNTILLAPLVDLATPALLSARRRRRSGRSRGWLGRRPSSSDSRRLPCRFSSCREGRAAPYFARATDHNVMLEIRRTRSLLPPVAAAADALVSPWLLADPTSRNDLPGRSRLGWLFGIPVSIVLGRALMSSGSRIPGAGPGPWFSPGEGNPAVRPGCPPGLAQPAPTRPRPRRRPKA
jgi:hypothetical protein